MDERSNVATQPAKQNHLPDWTSVRFVVVDPSNRWVGAIHREVVDQWNGAVTSVNRDFRQLEFTTCHSAREAMLDCELSNTIGLILFAEGMERDCLSILGNLSRHRRSLPTLIVGNAAHEDLLPVFYESGASAVLFDVKNDVPVAEWCVRILQKQ